MKINYTWAIVIKKIAPLINEDGYSVYAQWIKIGNDVEENIGYFTEMFYSELKSSDEAYVPKKDVTDLFILSLVSSSLSEEKMIEIDQTILSQIQNKTNIGFDCEITGYNLSSQV